MRLFHTLGPMICPGFSVELLADRPELVPAVGEIRWAEWGHPPEPEELSFWVETTERTSVSRAAGAGQLPRDLG